MDLTVVLQHNRHNKRTKKIRSKKMKKSKLIKIVVFSLSLALLIGSVIGIATSANNEAPTIISKNVKVDGNFSLVFAIDPDTVAGSDVTVKIYNTNPEALEGEALEKALVQTITKQKSDTTLASLDGDGVKDDVIIQVETNGVSAKDISDTWWIVSESNGASTTITYSVMEYCYERLYKNETVLATDTASKEYKQKTFYNRILEVGAAAQELLVNHNNETPELLATDYKYIVVENGTFRTDADSTPRSHGIVALNATLYMAADNEKISAGYFNRVDRDGNVIAAGKNIYSMAGTEVNGERVTRIAASESGYITFTDGIGTDSAVAGKYFAAYNTYGDKYDYVTDKPTIPDNYFPTLGGYTPTYEYVDGALKVNATTQFALPHKIDSRYKNDWVFETSIKFGDVEGLALKSTDYLVGYFGMTDNPTGAWANSSIKSGFCVYADFDATTLEVTGYYIMQDRSGGKASDQYKVAYFEPDKWYNLRIEYNRNTQVQYLYVNDVCVWGGTSMLVGTTEGEFTAIYFQMREKANKYYDVYFDNTGYFMDSPKPVENPDVKGADAAVAGKYYTSDVTGSTVVKCDWASNTDLSSAVTNAGSETAIVNDQLVGTFDSWDRLCINTGIVDTATSKSVFETSIKFDAGKMLEYYDGAGLGWIGMTNTKGNADNNTMYSQLAIYPVIDADNNVTKIRLIDGNYHNVVFELENHKWYNLRWEYDSSNETTKIYLNDTLIFNKTATTTLVKEYDGFGICFRGGVAGGASKPRSEAMTVTLDNTILVVEPTSFIE